MHKAIKSRNRLCPNLDPKTTVIIEEGRTPTAATLALALIVGGVILAIVPPAIWFFRRR
ncbi:MAG: hypothetical protein L0215_04750 [Gemmataceae bacterium]|nr:hypothetical protein [Gemmataceae bacterium]